MTFPCIAHFESLFGVRRFLSGISTSFCAMQREVIYG